MDQALYDKLHQAQYRHEPGTGLRVGLGVAAMIDTGAPGGRLNTHFTGFCADEYVAVAFPPDADAAHFAQGAKVQVRYLIQGKICSFETTVSALTREPYSTLYLAPPGSVELLEMRTEDRIDSFMPATVYYMGHDLGVVLLNLSHKGCRVLVKAAGGVSFQADTEIFVRVTFVGMAHELYLHGEVKNVAPFRDRQILGVALTDVSEEVERRIDEYLAILRELQTF